ncbi:hypothetical protein BC936DRAFT_142704 [Jimgerdemannia flammicorona]|uniref:Uncharacterized protein n=2 Tax=Jimgerdemannia flammicorona TaxID=994334 RepID=A0A433DEU1_9FUNG|nr:hypothetical protein BC936DRAFT_142704 [Jimgerdemannia flammicorona]RUS31217.1 hypothetical protein BC938DRAFT_478240 [Jimgerdemannia flammicorona]
MTAQTADHDRVLQSLEGEFKRMDRMFARGEMRAFGRNSDAIFKELDVIRRKQIKLAHEHIALDEVANDEIPAGGNTESGSQEAYKKNAEGFAKKEMYLNNLMAKLFASWYSKYVYLLSHTLWSRPSLLLFLRVPWSAHFIAHALHHPSATRNPVTAIFDDADDDNSNVDANDVGLQLEDLGKSMNSFNELSNSVSNPLPYPSAPFASSEPMARSASEGSAGSRISYAEGTVSGAPSRRGSGVLGTSKLPASVAAQQLAGGEASGKKPGQSVARNLKRSTTETIEVEMTDIRGEGKGKGPVGRAEVV